jgi:tetratricopeptide (TPR) repeat protein
VWGFDEPQTHLLFFRQIPTFMSKIKRTSPKLKGEKTRQSNIPLSSRLTSEQVLRDIHRVLEGQNFQNIDDVNAFLGTLSGAGLKRALHNAPSLSPQQQAQELAYQAMDARTKRQALALAKEALAKDADCVDALVIVAHETADSTEELIESMERAVAAGERSLGKQYFEKNKGHFWELIETRPYMRARSDLAHLLLESGQTDKAIVHFEAMIALNSSDNQGLRYILLGCYLSEGNVTHARRLMRKFNESVSAFFAWGLTLERILSGDFEGAERALEEARSRNRFVEPYLTARKKLPHARPDSYVVGSEDEAIICMDIIGRAWAKHPGSLIWLLRQTKGKVLKEK